MWANAQRDGCPAQYRWRPLFNAAKFGWCPLLGCLAIMLPRREIHWNLLGCPKLTNRSQPLVGRSSSYCKDMGEILLFNRFFQLSIRTLVVKIWPYKVVRWCADGDFLRPVFPANCVQHISDMHSKFALRLHYVSKYGRHPICDRWD